MMLTINELAKKTGLSTYELRRRVKAGSCPHIRVGAKASKILIDFDMFIDSMREENLKNMTISGSIDIYEDNFNNDMGHEKLRQII